MTIDNPVPPSPEPVEAPHPPPYTILSAQWVSDVDVLLKTAEAGAVVVNETDRPYLWATLQASGVTISPIPGPTAADLYAYAAAKRWERETAGIMVSGLPIASDVASQTKLAGAAQAATAGLLPATVAFKTQAGFIDVTPAQVRGVYAALVAHVQDCYARESQAAAGILAGTITTRAQVDAAFA